MNTPSNNSKRRVLHLADTQPPAPATRTALHTLMGELGLTHLVLMTDPSLPMGREQSLLAHRVGEALATGALPRPYASERPTLVENIITPEELAQNPLACPANAGLIIASHNPFGLLEGLHKHRLLSALNIIAERALVVAISGACAAMGNNTAAVATATKQLPTLPGLKGQRPQTLGGLCLSKLSVLPISTHPENPTHKIPSLIEKLLKADNAPRELTLLEGRAALLEEVELKTGRSQIRAFGKVTQHSLTPTGVNALQLTDCTLVPQENITLEAITPSVALAWQLG